LESDLKDGQSDAGELDKLKASIEELNQEGQRKQELLEKAELESIERQEEA
jgi:hypothetical protein